MTNKQKLALFRSDVPCSCTTTAGIFNPTPVVIIELLTALLGSVHKVRLTQWRHTPSVRIIVVIGAHPPIEHGMPSGRCASRH